MEKFSQSINEAIQAWLYAFKSVVDQLMNAEYSRFEDARKLYAEAIRLYKFGKHLEKITHILASGGDCSLNDNFVVALRKALNTINTVTCWERIEALDACMAGEAITADDFIAELKKGQK